MVEPSPPLARPALGPWSCRSRRRRHHRSHHPLALPRYPPLPDSAVDPGGPSPASDRPPGMRLLNVENVSKPMKKMQDAGCLRRQDLGHPRRRPHHYPGRPESAGQPRGPLPRYREICLVARAREIYDKRMVRLDAYFTQQLAPAAPSRQSPPPSQPRHRPRCGRLGSLARTIGMASHPRERGGGLLLTFGVPAGYPSLHFPIPQLLIPLRRPRSQRSRNHRRQAISQTHHRGSRPVLACARRFPPPVRRRARRPRRHRHGRVRAAAVFSMAVGLALYNPAVKPSLIDATRVRFERMAETELRACSLEGYIGIRSTPARRRGCPLRPPALRAGHQAPPGRGGSGRYGGQEGPLKSGSTAAASRPTWLSRS